MTQPDKWDEIATAMTRCWYRDAAQEYAIDTNQIAANLRSAYQEGERAGMERAAVIVEAHTFELDAFDGWHVPQNICIAKDTLAAIRAAKETKE